MNNVINLDVSATVINAFYVQYSVLYIVRHRERLLSTQARLPHMVLRHTDYNTNQH
jgi:hypothetical protein